MKKPLSISHYDSLDEQIGLLVKNHEEAKGWFIKVFKRELPYRIEWLKECSDFDPTSKHIERAISKNESVYELNITKDIERDVSFVMDWVMTMKHESPHFFSKLDRITWKQAEAQSKRWHEALARRAEKIKDGTIPFDDECPVMFTHDDGLKWVWLKTSKARDDEGRIMGHCVGSIFYGIRIKNKGVFSLRDTNGCPHVTMELKEDEIIQVFSKNNSPVPERYDAHVRQFHEHMKTILTMKPKPIGFDHIIHWNGDEEWYLNGTFHREDGPAIIRSTGEQEWWSHGRHHRTDGPATLTKNGDEEWFVDGKLHRDDGPAINFKSGLKEWFINGVHHRIGGPAIEFPNGAEHWYFEGKLHRENGPAKKIEDGNEEWYRHGKLHREDGPAVIRRGKGDIWYKNGVIHREDGPAVIYANGDVKWFLNGKTHREDGPAVTYSNGGEEWWIEGKLTNRINKTNEYVEDSDLYESNFYYD